ncbi:hypothetical protein ILUMI_27330 [Ignelater luminosus]|uniref:Uncharacterized protein n=1 Tax=Ignelater luminosus TaxID=2038154 RepID=A0A8K0C6R5_IGNLU|nr:hypothetical protein ILUMI_27330 [Ignelater luminosus]
MSARKSYARPNTNVSVKSKPSTPKQSLNATTLPTNLTNSTLNTTNLNCLVPKQAATDWSLQCDFANSEYLRAIIAKDITQVAAREYEDIMDSQLAQQFELLQKLIKEETKLKNEIDDLEVLLVIKKQFMQLEQSYNKLEEIIEGYKVHKNLISYVCLLEQACNRLHLKNIKQFEKQEDYDKFEYLLKNCTESLKKFKIIIGNIENIQGLASKIGKFIELQDESIKKQKLLNDLHVLASLNLFKNISDKFAVIRGYDE